MEDDKVCEEKNYDLQEEDQILIQIQILIQMLKILILLSLLQEKEIINGLNQK